MTLIIVTTQRLSIDDDGWEEDLAFVFSFGESFSVPEHLVRVKSVLEQVGVIFVNEGVEVFYEKLDSF